MNIAESIRVGLAKRHKTQRWLAIKMQTSPAYVSALCKGDKQLGMNKLAFVASIFEVKVSEFISWGE